MYLNHCNKLSYYIKIMNINNKKSIFTLKVRLKKCLKTFIYLFYI